MLIGRLLVACYALLGALFLAAGPGDALASAAHCASAAKGQIDAPNAVAALLAAAQAGDHDKFNALLTNDFYAYDGGKRFDSAAAFWSLIDTLRTSGKKYEWSVTQPETHLLCDWAWVTYVNKGSVTDASGRQDMTWLESAILRYDGGHWRVQFLHSTRAAK